MNEQVNPPAPVLALVLFGAAAVAWLVVAVVFFNLEYPSQFDDGDVSAAKSTALGMLALGLLAAIGQALATWRYERTRHVAWLIISGCGFFFVLPFVILMLCVLLGQ